jgi:hypothetical protein
MAASSPATAKWVTDCLLQARKSSPPEQALDIGEL